jgi:hypothetical protein
MAKKLKVPKPRAPSIAAASRRLKKMTMGDVSVADSEGRQTIGPLASGPAQERGKKLPNPKIRSSAIRRRKKDVI